MSILKEEKKKLSELSSYMQSFPQILVNVKLSKEKNIDDIHEIQHEIKKAENQLKNRGRLLIRPSGTEPILRIMAEGPDKKEI